MDGTLTPPRQKISNTTIRSLCNLSNHAKIGIVTGSGFDYLIQQCKDMWYDIGSVNPEKIFLMPCNGTQLYSWENRKWIKKLSKNLRDHLGSQSVDDLISELVHLQSDYMLQNPPHEFTGHFVSYRESLLNWCPVGRNATQNQRSRFIDYDNQTNIRRNLSEKLKESLFGLQMTNKVDIVLGGSTSIDIYPKGWDKTFCLDHFSDHTCWFVGDKCTGEGNDRLIYEKLLSFNRAYQTTGPENTLKIIEFILESIKNKE